LPPTRVLLAFATAHESPEVRSETASALPGLWSATTAQAVSSCADPAHEMLSMRDRLVPRRDEVRDFWREGLELARSLHEASHAGLHMERLMRRCRRWLGDAVAIANTPEEYRKPPPVRAVAEPDHEPSGSCVTVLTLSAPATRRGLPDQLLQCPQDDMARPTAICGSWGREPAGCILPPSCARETQPPRIALRSARRDGAAGSRIGVASARAESGAPS